jgi:hypothetical protein
MPKSTKKTKRISTGDGAATPYSALKETNAHAVVAGGGNDEENGKEATEATKKRELMAVVVDLLRRERVRETGLRERIKAVCAAADDIDVELEVAPPAIETADALVTNAPAMNPVYVIIYGREEYDGICTYVIDATPDVIETIDSVIIYLDATIDTSDEFNDKMEVVWNDILTRSTTRTLDWGESIDKDLLVKATAMVSGCD